MSISVGFTSIYGIEFWSHFDVKARQSVSTDGDKTNPVPWLPALQENAGNNKHQHQWCRTNHWILDVITGEYRAWWLIQSENCPHGNIHNIILMLQNSHNVIQHWLHPKTFKRVVQSCMLCRRLNCHIFVTQIYWCILKHECQFLCCSVWLIVSNEIQQKNRSDFTMCAWQTNICANFDQYC